MGHNRGNVPVTQCVAVASGFLAIAEVATVISKYAPALSSAGVSLVMEDHERPGESPPGSGIGDSIVLFVVTGGTERRVMELVGARFGARESEAEDPDVEESDAGESPAVILIAYPGRNSLPASLEVLARLHQDGMPGRIVFLDGPKDAEGIGRLREAVGIGVAESSPSNGAGAEDAAAAAARDTVAGGHPRKPPGRPLAGKRIGLIGEPSDWLVASSPSPDVVRESWGAEVVPIPLEEVVQRMEAGAGSVRDSTGSFARSFTSTATECREPTVADLESSGRIYDALRSLVEEHALDALTVRCFDLVTDLGATGCLALSRLADEGIIAGCEGDLVSAIGLLWAREATGETPWMANPARIDIARNTLTLAHCTVPCSLVDEFALRSHFESGIGAAVAGVIPAGPVTLLRVGGKSLDRLWVAQGEIAACGCDERMCRTQVEVLLSSDAASCAHVADLLKRPLGNHIVLFRGRHPAICVS